ncbi:Low molecular weight phosphotyrosine protein phosphatase [Cryptotrichosporon argae]
MPDTDREKVSVLMVCLGRSPMAEAVLTHRAALRPGFSARFDLRVDSAGTGAYHVGDSADERTIATCEKHGVPIACVSRKVAAADFDEFDYVLAMDGSNLQTLLGRAPRSARAYIALFGSFDPLLLSDSPSSPAPPGAGGRRPRAQSIDDPYYGGRQGFDACYAQCVRYADGLLDVIEGNAARP